MTNKSALFLGLLFIASNVLAGEKKPTMSVGISWRDGEGATLIKWDNKTFGLHYSKQFTDPKVIWNFDMEDINKKKTIEILEDLEKLNSIEAIPANTTIPSLTSINPLKSLMHDTQKAGIQLFSIYDDGHEKYDGPEETKEPFIRSAKGIFEKVEALNKKEK